MSWKKKRKKRKKMKPSDCKKIRYIIFTFLIILIIFLCLLLIHVCFTSRRYYSVESRVSELNKNIKENTSEDYDTFAWLKVQGTNIDYPIIIGHDETFEYPVDYESYGWSLGNDQKFHNVINIMGHNIFNLSSYPKAKSSTFYRFEELMGFVYYDVAKENKYIQLTIDGEDYVYKIFAVDFINSIDIMDLPQGDYSKKRLKQYLIMLKSNSLYDYDVSVDENDKIISVMTCTRFYGTDKYVDFVVAGRLVGKHERLNNYNVSKNSNYKEVEKILKGADNDDEDEA
jgi:sortase B